MRFLLQIKRLNAQTNRKSNTVGPAPSFPRLLLLQHSVERAEAVMPRGRDIAALDGLDDGAALLTEVGAIGIAAPANIGREIAHRGREVIEGEEVEAGEVEHAEAGGIG